MDRFDEACDVIVALLTQERSTYAGNHCALTEAYCEPKAVQRPHPGEIMTSAHLRYNPDDPKAVAAEAEAFAEAGLDLGIVYLPPPHTPADLETIAEVVVGI